MEEYLDIVDNEGNPTGEKIAKSLAHENGTLHKVIAVFIINSNNEVLLQKRSNTKKIKPNLWTCSAGGHIDFNEKNKNAACRELNEEMGIELLPEELNLGFVSRGRFIDERLGIDDNEIKFYYFANKDIAEVKIDNDEVSGYKYMDMEEFVNDYRTNPEHYSFDDETTSIITFLETKILEKLKLQS